MFNSQKTNTDPLQWVNPNSGGRYARQEFGDFEHKPRPEFDNNPNPILVAFRDRRETQPSKSIAELARGELVWLRRDLPAAFDATREHIDHAKRVLERLVRMSA